MSRSIKLRDVIGKLAQERLWYLNKTGKEPVIWSTESDGDMAHIFLCETIKRKADGTYVLVGLESDFFC